MHEVLHGHPTRSGRVNEALVFLPIGIVWPFRRFKAIHLRHHADERLTDPFDDPYVSYTFDAFGRTESVVNANGTIAYDYNALSQVESVTQNGQTIGYTYTDNGQRETMTLPGSRTMTYAYDPDTAMLEISNS